jgi:hypothetical protein
MYLSFHVESTPFIHFTLCALSKRVAQKKTQVHVKYYFWSKAKHNQNSAMKKSINPSIKECANCGTHGAKLTCAGCKSAKYCSKACQKQHWISCHKGRCIAPEKRRPQTHQAHYSNLCATKDAERGERDECPICFECLLDGTLCTLPCEHEFHRECVEELRKHGVLQACPLCRAILPTGPEKLFDEAMRSYVAVHRKVQRGDATWQALAAPDQGKLREVEATLITAAKQGYSEAQEILSIIYVTGEGVTRDYKKAAMWAQKAADQGHAMAQTNLSAM